MDRDEFYQRLAVLTGIAIGLGICFTLLYLPEFISSIEKKKIEKLNIYIELLESYIEFLDELLIKIEKAEVVDDKLILEDGVILEVKDGDLVLTTIQNYVDVNTDENENSDTNNSNFVDEGVLCKVFGINIL
jgi:O-phosphoseryl-tRNA(Cys) synthetase